MNKNYMVLAVVLLFSIAFAATEKVEESFVMIDRDVDRVVYNEAAKTVSFPVGKLIRADKENHSIFIRIFEIGEMGLADLDVLVLENTTEGYVLKDYVSAEVPTYLKQRRFIALNSLGVKLAFLDSNVIEQLEGWEFYQTQEMPSFVARTVSN